jgi:multidrug efflux system outer membrane protein
MTTMTMNIMPHPRFALRTAGAALALALAGCAHVPADTSLPAQPDFARVQHAASIKLARDGWPEARWWSAYRDPQLDQLIAQALKDNPTLAAAQARLMAARAALGADRAASGVQAGLSAGLNRQRYSGNGLFPEPIGGAYYNDASVQLKAGYDVDWWGKHRALVAASLGEVNARLAEYSQAEQTLAALVAQSYFRLQALWAREANAQARKALLRELVADREARIAHGLASIDEQRSAERELATLDEQAASLATQAGREREALRALTGAGGEALAGLAPRALPATGAALPQRLGFELLARRPDLQAAHWRVEASLGRVAASRAAYYPDLNLAGAIGLDAISLGKLLRTASRTVFLGSALDLPLFDSGRLDAQIETARAQRNELVADYNQRVLDAVREVATEGVTLQGFEQQAAAQAAARSASAALLASANKRYAQGLANQSALLQARYTLLQHDDAALQLQDATLQTQVALIEALGGGYRAAPLQAASTPTPNQQH